MNDEANNPMPSRFTRCESVADGLRRIVSAKLEEAALLAQDSTRQTDQRIHALRKLCKTVRATVKLLRPAMADIADRENNSLRDLAATFSQARDTTVMLEMLDNLNSQMTQPIPPDAIEGLRKAFRKRLERIRESVDFETSLQQATDTLLQIRDRVNGWDLPELGFQLIGPGLENTYRKGRKKLRKAAANPTPENVHDWRKRLKDHWSQMRLLEDLWSPVMSAVTDELSRCAHLLGDAHDAAVLRQHIQAMGTDVLGTDARKLFIDHIGDLERRSTQPALHVGSHIYAEKPRRFRKRIKVHWDTWRQTET